MNNEAGEQFERCDADGCDGARLQGRHCLEHLTAQEFDAAVVQLRAGEPLDARATKISVDHLVALLQALKDDNGRPLLPPTDFGGATFSGYADFREATFSGDADFSAATFSGDAVFSAATFSGDAVFSAATFSGYASFAEATFTGYAGFSRATFSARASFAEATFSGYTGFAGATFSGYADFGGATFSGYAGFDGATFSGHTVFRRATFSGHAVFDRATFSGYADFVELSCEGDASFARALFERARELGPFVVGSGVVLDDCVFLQRITLEVAARVLSARASTFAAGALLRIRWAEIAFDDADFARPSALSGATAWRGDNDLPPVCLLDGRHIELEARPRLMTLRGAQVRELSLSNVDLRACRFFGAHGLESLSTEASCEWPRPPTGRRYIDRETIAEEHRWRGWRDPPTQAPDWLKGRDGSEPLQPAQIATLYRALRKAREEAKDEPGAGDLYYGEMEMRRRSSERDGSASLAPASQDDANDTNGATASHTRMGGDTAILHLYWVLSGYGLRPARALIALAATLLAGAALLSWFGFHDPRTYGRSLLFSAESAISLLRPPEAKLTAGGEIVQIALRLLGPLFFGLALLAVRARVKR